MIAHKKTKELLFKEAGNFFLRNLIQSEGTKCSNSGKTFQVASYATLAEFAFSSPTDNVDIRGQPKTDFCFVDVLFFVGLGAHPAYNDDVFSVGVEIKENKEDLRGDHKMEGYLGKTDYTFLSVPEELVERALEKTKNMDGMGVISMPSGTIIKPAVRHKVDESFRHQVILRALFALSSLRKNKIFINPTLGVPSLSILPVEDASDGTSEIDTSEQLTLKKEQIMNFVGNRTAQVRIPKFELKNGKLSLWQGANQPPQEFDYAEGQLKGIEVRRRQTTNGEMVYCEFHFINGDEPFDIVTIASSCVTADLISKLRNVKDVTNSMLRVDAWQNNKYTNVAISENGLPVTYTALPRVQKIDRGFKIEADSTERDNAIMQIIRHINDKLQTPGGRAA